MNEMPYDVVYHRCIRASDNPTVKIKKDNGRKRNSRVEVWEARRTCLVVIINVIVLLAECWSSIFINVPRISPIISVFIANSRVFLPVLHGGNKTKRKCNKEVHAIYSRVFRNTDTN